MYGLLSSEVKVVELGKQGIMAEQMPIERN